MGSPHIQPYQGISPIDGGPYNRIIRRRTRCLDCNRGRIDREYQYDPAAKVY